MTMKQLTDEDPAMTQTRDADSSRPKPHAQQRASQTIPSTASKPGGFSVAMRHIDAEILAGRWVNGSRLPPERELAASLGISRGAVREAIRALEAQGILSSGTGRGNGTRVDARPSDAMGRILRLQLALEVVSFADLTETRVALEKAACAAAAQVRALGPLARAANLLAQMHDALQPDSFNALDTAFHVALAEAGDNRLMSDLAVAIREAVHLPILEAEHSLIGWEHWRDGLVCDHKEMLAAIENGDPERAAEVTEVHIRNAYETLLIGRD
ncbi:FCD domain protein [ [[Propionibacterium] namnetense SK182B-JCVI]|uniref:FCD domain protein n=3 Tax=Cutibacterium namnetense TaxID=1574624 RepID=F9NY73_9ACTN|nr:FCD domain protein [ [[Propionibacterium] namnetense SK182B-JCVI]